MGDVNTAGDRSISKSYRFILSNIHVRVASSAGGTGVVKPTGAVEFKGPMRGVSDRQKIVVGMVHGDASTRASEMNGDPTERRARGERGPGSISLERLPGSPTGSSDLSIDSPREGGPCTDYCLPRSEEDADGPLYPFRPAETEAAAIDARDLLSKIAGCVRIADPGESGDVPSSILSNRISSTESTAKDGISSVDHEGVHRVRIPSCTGWVPSTPDLARRPREEVTAVERTPVSASLANTDITTVTSPGDTS